MKKVGTDNKIREWFHDYESVDYTNVFDLYVPSELNLGKNQIKIDLVGNKLQKGSPLSIDIIDGLGVPIYHEISSIVNTDKTRSIVVWIYDDTAAGNCTLYISCYLGGNFDGKKYLYKTDILVNPETLVGGDFSFSDVPTIQYQEKVYYSTLTKGSESRKVQLLSDTSSKISILSRIAPNQINTNNSLNFEKPAVKNTTVVTPNVISGSADIETIELPKFFENSIVTAEGFEFSSSMVGGTIYLNRVNFPYPPNYSNIANLKNLSYSASIIKVINKSTIEIYPPIYCDTTYVDSGKNVLPYFSDRLFDHSNFTCSYYDYVSIENIPVTKSYAVVDIGGLNTEFGNVEQVKLTYKPVNEVGEFRDAGIYNLSPNNLFVNRDTQTLTAGNLGITYPEMGQFRSTTQFDTYWESLYGNLDKTPSVKLINGVYLFESGTNGDLVGFKLKTDYLNVPIYTNTDLNLSFNYVIDNSNNAQIDVFVSGSPVELSYDIGDYKPTYYTPKTTNDIGINTTYLGSITKNNKGSTASFKFKTKETGKIQPIFFFKSGSLHISEVQLQPTNVFNQTPNQAHLTIPLDNVIMTGSELIMKLDYLGGGTKTNYSSTLYGVKFDGVRTPIVESSSSVSPATSAVTGEIKMIAANSTPTGWLVCNGTAVSRTTYAALFAVIGTTFGSGDGSTTFNLPDMRDRFPVGAGSTFSVGASGGDSTVTLGINNLPAHNHTISIRAGTGTLTNDPNENILGGGKIYTNPSNYDSDLSSFNTGTTGSATPISIVPKYISFRYIICYLGETP